MANTTPELREILLTDIPRGDRREIATLIIPRDKPERCLLLRQADSVRSAELLAEEAALNKISAGENRRNNSHLSPPELNIIQHLSSQEIKDIVTRVSPEMKGNTANREYVVKTFLSI